MYVCMYGYLCMYVCMYVCKYVWLSMYVYMYHGPIRGAGLTGGKTREKRMIQKCLPLLVTNLSLTLHSLFNSYLIKITSFSSVL